MDSIKAKQRIDYLKKEIEYHNKEYYELDSPKISDYEYDMLYRELESMEIAYPEYRSQTSPTQKVGGDILKSFGSVIHDVPMESLHDSFSIEEIRDFDKRIREKTRCPEYVVEPKIDGLSISLEYRNGVLFRASTRGDGLHGEDITANAMAMKSVPAKLNEDIPFIEVRAEVYMSEENFLKLIKKQEDNEGKIFKNPRNAAAGSLRQKDPKITRDRNLSLFVFNVQKITGEKLYSHKESLKYLEKLGLPVIPFYNAFNDINDVIAEIERIGEIRGGLGFPLDGAVVKLNSFTDRKTLGSTSKFPKWAEAFKYPPEEKITNLLKVEFNVGRTGTITPTGIFEPVELAGTTVSRATLHNEDFINNKGIKIGDLVVLRKAGEIIPELVKVKQHSDLSQTIVMPKLCPSCGSKVIREEGASAIKCINSDCPAQLLRHLIHFVSRDAMDIDGLGSAILEQLIENNLISSPSDIYNLKFEDIFKMERMGNKSTGNLLSAIERSKKADLYRLIYALGIEHIGLNASKLLSAKFLSMEKIMSAKAEDIGNIEGFGEIMAKSVVSYFSLNSNKELISEFIKYGLNMKALENDSDFDNRFENLTFVLTGTLDKFTRIKATEIIENYNGKVSSSISKKTSYVVAGESPGSKVDKAKKLGVKILSEQEFLEMI